jgi:hypothetical protein
MPRKTRLAWPVRVVQLGVFLLFGPGFVRALKTATDASLMVPCA